MTDSEVHRVAYYIHEAVCTAYKHEGRNALCERAAIAVMASDAWPARPTECEGEHG